MLHISARARADGKLDQARVIRLRTGWPCVAMQGVRWNFGGPARPPTYVNAASIHPKHWTDLQADWDFLFSDRMLPLRPLWLGFALNTLFYAGLLWAMWAGPFALRRMIRKRRGHCPHCNYPIGQSPVCTECGAAVTPQASGDQGIKASSR